jgi:hypothetical protein
MPSVLAVTLPMSSHDFRALNSKKLCPEPP